MVAADTVKISAGRAQDWIDTVINPVLDGIRRELRFLPNGPWRWQPKTRLFEFFLLAKAYVPHPYGDNYDDFVEKYEGVRNELGAHDTLLVAFAAKFERGFDALRADRESFKSELDASLTGRGRSAVPPDFRDWFVSYVAGGFERVPDYYVGHDVYNRRADRLLAAGREVLARAKIDVAGFARKLADQDAKLATQLVNVRRDLADHYGARVRPA
jgi:hypothetical protein